MKTAIGEDPRLHLRNAEQRMAPTPLSYSDYRHVALDLRFAIETTFAELLTVSYEVYPSQLKGLWNPDEISNRLMKWDPEFSQKLRWSQHIVRRDKRLDDYTIVDTALLRTCYGVLNDHLHVPSRYNVRAHRGDRATALKGTINRAISHLRCCLKYPIFGLFLDEPLPTQVGSSKDTWQRIRNYSLIHAVYPDA
jgi:hypothetical protein